jgi:hypothetical protein
MWPGGSTTGSSSSLVERPSLRIWTRIPFGVDFRTYLDEQVAKCEVFLAVIGRDWMKNLGSTGKTRLDDPRDFVRSEIESALKRQIPVIPVLVSGATISSAERLPATCVSRTGAGATPAAWTATSVSVLPRTSPNFVPFVR